MDKRIEEGLDRLWHDLVVEFGPFKHPSSDTSTVPPKIVEQTDESPQEEPLITPK